MLRYRHALLALVLGFLAACGSSSTSTPSQSLPPGFYITISAMSFSPIPLKVPSGATVTVINDDGIPHSVTSEATAGAFTPGAVGGVSFDTGQFSSGTKTFTLQAAAEGTTIPYYCTVHKASMATPNGSIVIDNSAKPFVP